MSLHVLRVYLNHLLHLSITWCNVLDITLSHGCIKVQWMASRFHSCILLWGQDTSGSRAVSRFTLCAQHLTGRSQHWVKLSRETTQPQQCTKGNRLGTHSVGDIWLLCSFPKTWSKVCNFLLPVFAIFAPNMLRRYSHTGSAENRNEAVRLSITPTNPHGNKTAESAGLKIC